MTGICESPRGVYWIATGKGVTRYEPRKMELAAPKLSVQLDQEYTDLATLPSVLQGRLVTFKCNTVDTKTRAEVRRFRWRVVEGRASAEQLLADGRAAFQAAARTKSPEVSDQSVTAHQIGAAAAKMAARVR